MGAVGPLVIWGVGVLLAFGVLVSYAGGPMSRVRVERFARRQRLDVTVGNGNQIIRYLATTRRWRATGFAAGLLVSTFTAPANDSLHVDFVTLFAGWFLGALVAEVRVAHLAHGAVRVASLQPRRPRSYLGRFSWALVPASAATATAVAAATVVAELAGWAAPAVTAWLSFAVALAAAVAVRAVQHAVLRRPQPLTAPDVLAGDDAVRSRSLHVLAGGGAALVLLCVLAQLGSMHLAGRHGESTIHGIQSIGVFLVAALGWNVATSVWPPHGRGSARTGASRQ